jgi:type III secretion system FlhB-like substrate exporter
MERSVLKAAALRYPDWADAPFIAAKARGALAERLLEIARQNDIPIVKDADLTDVLTLQEVGSYIPPETYQVLAGIFALLKRIEQKHG